MEHNTRMLGGISYIVLLAASVLGSFVPLVGLISLAAGICVVVAFIKAGTELGKPQVKSGIITALILNIVAGIILMFVMGAAIVAILGASGGQPDPSELMSAFGGGSLIGMLVCWILWMIGGWFWFQAGAGIAEATGTPLFKTGGLLIFIGAITVIVFGLGGIVMLIGEILQCVAFFQTSEREPQTA